MQAGKPIKILVVDDMPAVRKSMCRFLNHAGYQTVEAENGQEGLKKFSSENPDAVLSDYSMPIMTGDKMVAQIKEQRASIPVIVLSADAPDEILSKLIRYDNLAILSKPFDLKVFEEALDYAIKNQIFYHGPENRDVLRVSANLPANIANYGPMIVEDISLFGLFLQTDQNIKIGTPLTIDLDIDHGMNLKTIVVRKRGEDSKKQIKPGIGVKFVELSNDQEKLIEKYVFDQARKSTIKNT